MFFDKFLACALPVLFLWMLEFAGLKLSSAAGAFSVFSFTICFPPVAKLWQDRWMHVQDEDIEFAGPNSKWFKALLKWKAPSDVIVREKLREANLIRLACTFAQLYVLLGFAMSVQAAMDGIVYMNSNSNAAFKFGQMFGTAAIAATINDAIGTTPAKNFKKFVDNVKSKGVDERAVFAVFQFCIYSANPTVWTKIMSKVDKTVVPSGILAVWKEVERIMPGGSDAILVYSRAQSMTSNAIRTTGILSSDPSVAAWAWVTVLPNSLNTYENFVGRRFAPAMKVTLEVLEDCANTQKKFMKEVMKKTSWEQKFFDTTARSNYEFVQDNSTNKLAVYGAGSGLDRAGVVGWINSVTNQTLPVPAAVPTYSF